MALKGKIETDVTLTICFPIIRQDFILGALKSLKKHTPPVYKTIVVNMSQPNREFEDALYGACDIVIRSHYNYGFAQASNLAMRLAPTPYVAIVNDDVSFLQGWLEGIMLSFEKFPRAIAVAPMSPKEPGWGYGEPGYRYLITKVDAKAKKAIEPYEALRQEIKALSKRANELPEDEAEEKRRMQAFIRERMQALNKIEPIIDEIALKASQKPESIKKLAEGLNGAVIDAIAMWAVIFRTKEWQELGMFDERFTSGGGEDYCACYRIYKQNCRAIASSFSWVFHRWGRSKDQPSGFDTALPLSRPPWNKLSTKGFGDEGLYHPDVSVWATEGERTDDEVWQAPL